MGLRPDRGPFMIELVHQLLATGLVEQTVAASMYPTMNNEFHPRIQMEAQEHGSDLEVCNASSFAKPVAMIDLLE